MATQAQECGLTSIKGRLRHCLKRLLKSKIIFFLTNLSHVQYNFKYINFRQALLVFGQQSSISIMDVHPQLFGTEKNQTCQKLAIK